MSILAIKKDYINVVMLRKSKNLKSAADCCIGKP
jgi:hypothetical protein